MTYNNIIFDLDNTLGICNDHYLDKIQRFSELHENKCNLPASFCSEVVQAIDHAMMKLPGGFDVNRFPNAFRAASYALQDIAAHAVPWELAHVSYKLAQSVYDDPYELFPGVYDMLMEFKNAGRKLFLYTKGHSDVQMKKIQANGLSDIFATNQIYIVIRKDAQTLQEIIGQHKLAIRDTLIVGDSQKDEIVPACQLGMDSVWIKGNYQNTFDAATCFPTYTFTNVTELLSLIPIPAIY